MRKCVPSGVPSVLHKPVEKNITRPATSVKREPPPGDPSATAGAFDAAVVAQSADGDEFPTLAKTLSPTMPAIPAAAGKRARKDVAAVVPSGVPSLHQVAMLAA